MPVAHNRDLQQAEQFARELFASDPQMNIDDAARKVNAKCRRGLVKNVLSNIRRDVRQAATPEPVVTVPKEEVTMVAARQLQQTVVAGASSEALAQREDRVKFLETWALEHPLATIEEARQAVRDEFGISVGTKQLSDTLRMAKQLWEAQRLEAVEKHKPVEPPPQLQEAAPVVDQRQHLTKLAHEMRAAKVRLMEILADGRVRIEFEPD